MYTERSRSEVLGQVHSRGVRAFKTFLTPAVFAQAASQAGCRIIPRPLNLVNLVWLGLACALDTTKSFAAVITTTVKILAAAPHSPLGQGGSPSLPTCPNHRAGRRAAEVAVYFRTACRTSVVMVRRGWWAVR